MKNCGLDGRTFQPTIKVNQNYKPTNCDTTAIFYTMCQRFVFINIKMTQEQADDICKTALPFSVYGKIDKSDMINVANSIMFYCACMIKKSTDYDCDLEFNIRLRNPLFKAGSQNER